MEPQNQIQQMPDAASGQGTDSVVGHLSLGEIVIPRAFLDDPHVMQMLQQLFQQNGADIGEFTVGDKANKINPETGEPEFFHWGKLGNILKIAAPIALSVLAPGLGTAIGSSILGAGAAGASTLGSALLGAGTGALTGGGKGALFGGVTGGLGANLGNISKSIGNGLESAGNSVGGIFGDGTLGTDIGKGISSLADGSSSVFGGDNTLGKIGSVATNFSPSVSGGAGETFGAASALPSTLAGGGGSTFNLGSALASGIGGVADDSALKKAQKQLLAGNQQQLTNLDSFDPSGLTSDPGYQFNLAEGQKGLDRAASAGGSLLSGGALKAASQYNQGYADNAFNNYYNRWANKAGAQNNLIGSNATNQAQLGIAQANNLGTSLAGALNPNQGLTSAQLLKLLNNRA